MRSLRFVQIWRMGIFMADKTVKLGFLPTRRMGVFDEKTAVERKAEVDRKLADWGTEYVNLDFLNEDGLIFHYHDAAKVAKHFIDSGVDAVFAAFCNFGCEEAVMKVAKLVGKPLLLWGPRDPAPLENLSRATDSQCGLFAAGKVLRQAGVSFTYIENCATEDAAFAEGFQRFMSAACVVKSMQGLRIGQIGVRPDLFWSVKCNELELYEKLGIEVTPITLNHLKRMFDDTAANRKQDIRREVESFTRAFDCGFDEGYLEKAATLKLCIRQWMEEESLSAAASYCWGVMADSVGGIVPCFTFSELTDEHLPVICETDIMGAITSVMVQAATRWEKASFLADLTMRHPTNDNAELFWHCGVFPKSTARKDIRPSIGLQFNRHIPAVSQLELDSGDITIARMDGDHGKYSLLYAHGRSVEGPPTTGAYGWIGFDNWPELEKKFVCGPYIHHCVGIHGHYGPVLEEALHYLPEIAADRG